jgi:hypothetical protein
MFEQGGDVALDLLKLIQLQGRVDDGEHVARCGLFVDENPLAVAQELFFDFEQALAFGITARM